MATVAIIGRPNVGKSTLFNRLVGKRVALVDDQPGVTRDRREGEGRLGHLTFRVFDTAGLETAVADALEARMVHQTERAIVDADVCLFMIDARVGIAPADEHFGNLVRQSGRPVILLANKVEGRKADAGIVDAYGLGLGDPIAISSEHGEGMAELAIALQEALDGINASFPVDEFPDALLHEDDEDVAHTVKLAIVGRPNAGKSTLINTMLGDERLLTGPEAGITRDAISVDWTWEGRPIELVDTAGLRKKARVAEKLEKLSVSDALRSIQFAQVVVLLMDAANPFEKQDLRIAHHVVEEGRALVLAINKWDLVEDKQDRLAELREMAERLLPQVRGVPLVTLSSLTGHGVDRVMPAVFKICQAWNARVGTGGLNRWLAEAQERHPPPAVRGKRIRLRYMTQAKTRPPTFVVFAGRPEALPKSYERYLINGIRESFEISGTPIRLYLRKNKNPYADKK